MPQPGLKTHLLNSASGDKWRAVGMRRRSGIIVPLFSVYSKNSFGIGDLADLKLLIDWAALSGNSILQLLPLNELAALHCPYDSLSSFALEPAYISLNHLPGIKAGFRRRSPGKPGKFVDYSVKEEKLRLLWELFLPLDLSEAEDFERFQQENAYWLMDFALFKVLKEHHQGKPWYEWEQKYMARQQPALDDFKRGNIEALTFQMWLQWVLYRQLKQAKDYAARKNILLKGDLPILVSRDSADVWMNQNFFKLAFTSGAPPDMYCAKGQRWGMPTYNWEQIAGDGYRYIKEKLKYAQEFYDILRIDHVVGLFRIWSIPYNEPQETVGLNGLFDPQDEKLWAGHGRKILEVLLENTRMLLCAEDLGVVPAVCTQSLWELGIPGNDVQRWVKDWKIRHDFLLPQEFRELSVATLSTHDTTNWRAWWQYEAGTVDEGLFSRMCASRGIDLPLLKNELFDSRLSRHGRLRWKTQINTIDALLQALGRRKEEAADFIELYKNTYAEKDKLWKLLGCRGPVSEEAGTELLAKAIRFTLDSRAVLCINSAIDLLGLAGLFAADPYEYRFNLPGSVNAQNWSLRLPLALEQIIALPVNRKIKSMVIESGRG